VAGQLEAAALEEVLHEDAAAVLDLEQAHALELVRASRTVVRLTPELLGQFALGRKPRARAQVTADDAGPSSVRLFPGAAASSSAGSAGAGPALIVVAMFDQCIQ